MRFNFRSLLLVGAFSFFAPHANADGVEPIAHMVGRSEVFIPHASRSSLSPAQLRALLVRVTDNETFCNAVVQRKPDGTEYVLISAMKGRFRAETGWALTRKREGDAKPQVTRLNGTFMPAPAEFIGSEPVISVIAKCPDTFIADGLTPAQIEENFKPILEYLLSVEKEK